MSVETTVINLAFFIVCVVLYKPLQKTVKFALSSYQSSIKSNIESVLESKSEHDKILKIMVNKNDNLDKEVDEIIDQARIIAAQMEENAKKEIEDLVEKKLQYMRKKIEEENILLMQHVRQNCVEIAVNTIKQVIENNYSNKEDQKKILDYSCEKMKEII